MRYVFISFIFLFNSILLAASACPNVFEGEDFQFSGTMRGYFKSIGSSIYEYRGHMAGYTVRESLYELIRENPVLKEAILSMQLGFGRVQRPADGPPPIITLKFRTGSLDIESLPKHYKGVELRFEEETQAVE